ncbi:hypothetical protein COLU111180_20575 [Cohnella lubricantis]|uniref:Uncharacterized protein n=1 Tax=Cohnella lubricantis TaxID=2163172 RepID=A0A841TJP3_9BACL|nr:hypothetical protein [Cohnella lubricantis]MBB6678711.1 hypothetical protein [Cohnella lubricantis]MBP2119780.1 hypothetical protein [Cohnella lubricantis]
MRLTDTLFYWLQMKLMTDRRPEDEAARASLRYFAQILSEDHGLQSIRVASCDHSKIYVTYEDREHAEQTVWFDREAAEQLGNDLYGAAEDPA